MQTLHSDAACMELLLPTGVLPTRRGRLFVPGTPRVAPDPLGPRPWVRGLTADLAGSQAVPLIHLPRRPGCGYLTSQHRPVTGLGSQDVTPAPPRACSAAELTHPVRPCSSLTSLRPIRSQVSDPDRCSPGRRTLQPSAALASCSVFL